MEVDVTKKKTDGRRYRTGWTDDQDLLIIKAHEENGSIKALAKKMGIHSGTVKSRMLSLGIQPRTKRSPRKWTPEMEQVVRRYLNTETREEIGKRLGVSKASVISFVKRIGLAGIAPAAPQPWTTDEDLFLQENVGSMSQAKLAEELGREKSSVFRRLEKLGIKPERAVVTYIAPKAIKQSQVIPLKARPWLTRTSQECKYLYGQRHAYLACCEPVWGDTGHCEAHAALCGGYKKVAA